MAAPTLQEMMLALAAVATDLRESEATDGSSTTLLDNSIDQPDGTYKHGSLFFKTGALSGYSVRVVDHFPQSTLKFVNPDISTPSVAAGDDYAVMTLIYTRGELMGSINEALRELGPYVQLGSGQFTANAYEYNIGPSPGIDAENILQLEYKLAGDDFWTPHQYWSEKLSKLIIWPGFLPPASTPFQVYFRANHLDLTGDKQRISPYVNPTWLKWKAVEHLERRRFARTQGREPKNVVLLNEAKANLLREEAVRTGPRHNIPIAPRLGSW